MAGSSTPEQDGWIARVLGVQAGAAMPPQADAEAAMPPRGDVTGGVDAAAPPAAAGMSAAVAPAGDAAAAPPAEAPVPVITRRTVAPQPSDRTRLKIGVGEEVNLSVVPGPGAWTATAGKLVPASGAATVFTAPGAAASVDVTVTVGGKTATVTFQVIEPSTVAMAENGKRHKLNHQPNAGFHANIYVGPDSVSFYNIETLEHDVGAVATGYWAAFNGVGHSPGTDWMTFSNTVTAGKGTKSDFMDNCLSGWTGATGTLAGSMSFAIPWVFRVKGSGGGGSRLATVTQSVTSIADGTTSITKGGVPPVSFKLTDGEVTYPGAIY